MVIHQHWPGRSGTHQEIDMAKKPTFTLRRRDGTAEEVAYTPLMVIVGDQAHKLALHRDNIGQWVVSDPKSGACVIRHVHGQYKGIRVSSRNLKLSEIRQLALADVDALVQRFGSSKFNAVLANPKPF
jgi:hypothetical protein